MSEDQKRNLIWYLKLAGEGLLFTAGYYTTDLLQLFPANTLANQIAVPAGFLLGFIIRSVFKTKSDYQKDVLPGGLSKVMDKIPDSITGIRGSK